MLAPAAGRQALRLRSALFASHLSKVCLSKRDGGQLARFCCSNHLGTSDTSIDLRTTTRRHYSSSVPVGLAVKSSGDYDSDSDEHLARPSTVRKRRLKDILGNRKGYNKAMTFNVNGSVKDAISHFTRENLSACIAVKDDGDVVGIFTARDMLSFIHNKHPSNVPDGHEKALSACVEELLTRKNKVIFCSPEDSVRHCREIMFQHKIRHVPVIHNGNVLGIVSIGELSDSTFSVENAGGKKSFMRTTLGRLGLPEGTRATSSSNLNDVDGGIESASAIAGEDSVKQVLVEPRYSVTLSEYALPHPFKHTDGVGASRRAYGPGDLCADLSLCEDAHFSMTVNGSSTPFDPEPASHVYMVVADGVGSWRQYGVDPRLYAHRLVSNAKSVIESDALQRQLINDQGDDEFGGRLFDSEPVHPEDVIVDAWTATDAEEVTGSSTICVASIDTLSNQLTVSNLGDGGLMVVRHMQSTRVGYTTQSSRDVEHVGHNMGIAFLSQQQLRSFNLPFQLGYSGIPEHQGNFEMPSDATTFSIPVQPGDVIVLATDGLFDNIDLDEIVSEIEDWEDKWFGILYLKEEHPTQEQDAMNALAKGLVEKARELSLDKSKDSPFALLAKDNDIMWSGGMPDDTTVLCARVYEKASS